jgi:hypothetical protein
VCGNTRCAGPGTGGGAAGLGPSTRDPGEETLANPLQVKGCRAEQAQAVALGLEHQGPQPGLQRKRRQIAAETAQNAVPQLMVGGHAIYPKCRIFWKPWNRIPIHPTLRRAE